MWSAQEQMQLKWKCCEKLKMIYEERDINMNKSKTLICIMLIIATLSVCTLSVSAAVFISENLEIINTNILDSSVAELVPKAATNFCIYDSQNAAMRAAKMSVNIPLSQACDSVERTWIVGADGNYYESVTEYYGSKYIRHDSMGHLFEDGSSLARHYNAGYYDANGNHIKVNQHFGY